jgi:prepilin-type N-terminal cleavage/methylation domain-containing protein
MFCVRNKRGFTLIEVMLGVMIMAMFVIAIYRFLQTDLEGVAAAQQMTVKEASVRSLLAVLKNELQALPQGQQGALLGQPHVFSGQAADEITWVTNPGDSNGLFTNYYSGDYTVKMTVQPNTATNQNDLGIWRSLPDDPTPQNWLTLLPNVSGLEIRYYDPNLNAWVDTWSDQKNRPTMVRFRIWRGTDISPYESIVSMPMKGAIVLNLSNDNGQANPQGGGAGGGQNGGGAGGQNGGRPGRGQQGGQGGGRPGGGQPGGPAGGRPGGPGGGRPVAPGGGR